MKLVREENLAAAAGSSQPALSGLIARLKPQAQPSQR
jgi:hypothetical protein